MKVRKNASDGRTPRNDGEMIRHLVHLLPVTISRDDATRIERGFDRTDTRFTGSPSEGGFGFIVVNYKV